MACCKIMHNELDNEDNPYNNGLIWPSNDGTLSLLENASGEGQHWVVINYCPWCGAKLVSETVKVWMEQAQQNPIS